jgi:dihydrofolate reductase
MGGGDTIRQAVRDGLTDELRIHLSPIVMGTGTPLFRPEPGTRARGQCAKSTFGCHRTPPI